MNIHLANRMSSLFAEGAYKVLAQAQSLEKQGKSIIHFEIGQPDFDTPHHISDAGINAIKAGKTRYTSSLGIPALREAIAQQISKTRNIQTDPHQVAVCPSGKTALFVALGSIVNPGDEVIYPDPGFPSYLAIINFFGGKGRPLPMLEKNGFSLDFSTLKKLLTKKTRCIILNSPSNPTGKLIPKKDLEVLVSLVANTNCWIVSDEIYNSLVGAREPFVSIYSLPGMKKRTLIVDGFSKTYAMTGWRLGYLIFPKQFEEKIDNFITHLVGCTASFTQEAGLAAIAGSQKATINMNESYRKRRDHIVSGLNSIAGIRCMMPDGAFYVFPNITQTGMNSETFADFALKKAGVALLPGTCFGRYGEGYIRISYATAIEKIDEGLSRLSRSLIPHLRWFAKAA